MANLGKGNKNFDADFCHVITKWREDTEQHHRVNSKHMCRRVTNEYLAKGYYVAWSNALIDVMRHYTTDNTVC